MGAIHANDKDFDEVVLQSDQPVLVDFWAPWCGPCRQMGPVVDQIAEEMAGRAKVVKVDIEENPALQARYGVSSIPMFVIFKNGEMVKGMLGSRPKKALVEPLESFIDAE